MNRQHIACENKKLLQIAKNVFGEDLVNNAWLYNMTLENEGIEIFNRQIRSLNNQKDMNGIDLQDCVVIIEFINNKKVQFTCSEWGDVSSLDFDNFDKVFKS